MMKILANFQCQLCTDRGCGTEDSGAKLIFGSDDNDDDDVGDGDVDGK